MFILSKWVCPGQSFQGHDKEGCNCQSTLSYPREAQDNNISETVVVLFDIDSNCRLVNIRIEKGIGFGCDEEAIKALKKCKPIFNGTKRICTPILNLRQPFTFKNQDDQ